MFLVVREVNFPEKSKASIRTCLEASRGGTEAPHPTRPRGPRRGDRRPGRDARDPLCMRPVGDGTRDADPPEVVDQPSGVTNGLAEDCLFDAALLRRAVVPGWWRALPSEHGQGGRRGLGRSDRRVISFGKARSTYRSPLASACGSWRWPASRGTRSTSFPGTCPATPRPTSSTSTRPIPVARGWPARCEAAAQTDLHHRPRRCIQPVCRDARPARAR